MRKVIAFVLVALVTVAILMLSALPGSAARQGSVAGWPGASTSYASTFTPKVSSTNAMNIAFIRNGDVHIYSMDTGEVRKITNSGNVTAVDARSDGFIVYATYQLTGSDEVTLTIDTINADASSWREVKRWTETSDWEPINSISVSPVRNTVVYTGLAHQLCDYYTLIESVDLDTGQEQRLTEIIINGSIFESYCYASFSPAGDRLACLHAIMDDSGNADLRLATMATDGSNRTDFFNIGNTKENLACPPSWSPDGTKLAFIGLDRQVWGVTASGTGAERIANIGEACLFPSWVPDGSLVAFNSVNKDYPMTGNIYSVDSKSGTTSKLTGDSTDMQPKWFRVPSPAPRPTSRIWGHDSIGTPQPATDWYLAEGCTGTGFETWVLLQNPGSTPANVQVTYMTPEGNHPGPSEVLPPNSRKTYNVADTVPGAWQVSTKVHSDKPVVAERAMYGAGRAWGTDSIGASKASKTWYLAEGCTAGGFETWVLVQNPNDEAADVSLTYMTPEGSKTGPSMSLPPNSRQTFNVADTVPDTWEVSTLVTSKQPVVAERAVYWNNRKGAHDSVGVTSPETTWYLAEGSTAGGFETWILVQNPGDTTASVDLTYMTETGQVAGPHLDLAAHSRQTVNVADKVPSTWSVSTKVTAEQPVIAERAVYWNNRIEGHDSIGTTSPVKTWYLAEGSTGAGFETWVLVQNPNNAPANVVLTYMTSSGPVDGPAETIPANSRKTFNMGETVPDVFEVSTKVTSDIPVIAERAMYGDGK